jgi:hypothetical protein
MERKKTRTTISKDVFLRIFCLTKNQKVLFPFDPALMPHEVIAQTTADTPTVCSRHQRDDTANNFHATDNKFVTSVDNMDEANCFYYIGYTDMENDSQLFATRTFSCYFLIFVKIYEVTCHI